MPLRNTVAFPGTRCTSIIVIILQKQAKYNENLLGGAHLEAPIPPAAGQPSFLEISMDSGQSFGRQHGRQPHLVECEAKLLGFELLD